MTACRPDWFLRAGRLLTIVALVGATAACGATTRGHAVAEHALPSVSDVRWGACEAEGSGDTPKLPANTQCGVLTVPIDYSKPDTGSAHLGLVRIPATGTKIGSLVLNPGGPGESGVDAAIGTVDALPRQIREKFDVVGFDPRGVGSSTPSLRCDSDADDDAQRVDPQVDFSPAGVARIEDKEKQFVQRCVDKVGKEFLANVGTASVVKDLDALRAALGDEKLTYLGYSYGTLIGSLYGEAFPDKVRAMILDGVVDPSENEVHADIAQAAGFQKAFDAYAADCAKDANCPLGTDPAKAVDVFHHLIDPLVARPAPTTDPRGLSYSDALTGTQLAMYTPDFWTHLTDGLRELSQGTGDTLLKLADVYLGRDDTGHYSNTFDALIGINCVDHPPITDRAQAIDIDRQVRQVAPFQSYGAFTGDAPLDTCAFWPVPPTTTPHPISAPGLPPTLVVSTTNDPATPYQAGVDVAKEIGGDLLTHEGTQHTTVFQGDACVDGYATAYLVDLTRPPAGAKCG